MNPERFGSVGCRPLRHGGSRSCTSLTCTLAFAMRLRKIVEKLDQNRRKMLTTVRFIVIWPSCYGQARMACCFRLRFQATLVSLRWTDTSAFLVTELGCSSHHLNLAKTLGAYSDVVGLKWNLQVVNLSVTSVPRCFSHGTKALHLKHAAFGLARVQRTPQMRTTRFILGQMIYVVMTIKPSCQSCMLHVIKAEGG